MKNENHQAEVLSADQQALITNDLIGYADAVAMKYAHCGVELDEVKSAARHGLCEAALHFDPKRKNSFKTYATFYILKYIMQAIELWTSPMHVPKSLRSEVKMLSLEIPITSVTNRSACVLYDEESCAAQDSLMLEDVVPSDDEPPMERLTIKEVMRMLSPVERKVANLVYGIYCDPMPKIKAERRLKMSHRQFTKICNSATLILKENLQ